MQRIVNAFSSSTSSKKEPTAFQHQSVLTKSSQTKHALNKYQDENRPQQINSNQHSKNPSITSFKPFLQTNNRTKAQNQVNQSLMKTQSKSIGNTLVSRSLNFADKLTSQFKQRKLLSQHKPKEIEEIFDSARSYNPKAIPEQDQNHEQNLMQREKMRMTMYQDLKQNLASKFSVQSSQRKQAPTSGKIQKKQCQDDEAQAYHTLMTYQQPEEVDIRSGIDSMDSSYSVSLSLTTSIEKHNKYNEISKILGIHAFNSQHFQTISVPSSTASQRNNKLVNQNTSQSRQSKPLMSSTIALTRLKTQNQKRLPIGFKKAAPKSQIRYQQVEFLQKQKHNPSNLSPKLQLQLLNEAQSERSNTISTSFYHQTTSLNNLATGRSYQRNQVGAAHLAVPSLQQQPPPQAKKIKDDYSQESIDSLDMLSNQDLTRENIRDELDSKHHKHQQSTSANGGAQQTTEMFPNGCSQKSLATSRSGAFSKLDHPLSRMERAEQQRNINNNYQSMSSANKRAKWDLSAGKSTLQNSFRKGSTEVESTGNLLKAKVPLSQDKDNQKSKMQQLQQQYLAIKKQLQELHMSQKEQMGQNDNNYFLYNQDQEDILSPQIISEFSPTNENYQKLILNQKKQAQINKQISQAQREQQTQHKQTASLQTTGRKDHVRQKKQSLQFKSLDIQILPAMLQQKQDEESQQLPSPDKFQEQKKLKSSTVIYRDDKEGGGETALLKSQLQIGLRKLSINKNSLTKESRKQKLSSKKKQHMSSVSFKLGSPQGIRQQDSHSSSFERYQDCVSSQGKLGLSQSIKMPEKSSRKKHQHKSLRSSVNQSTRFYDIPDADDSICSCCREEIKHKNNSLMMKPRDNHKNRVSSKYSKGGNHESEKPKKRREEHSKNSRNNKDGSKRQSIKEIAEDMSSEEEHIKKRKSRRSSRSKKVGQETSRKNKQKVEQNPWLASRLPAAVSDLLRSYDQSQWLHQGINPSIYSLQQAQLLPFPTPQPPFNYINPGMIMPPPAQFQPYPQNTLYLNNFHNHNPQQISHILPQPQQTTLQQYNSTQSLPNRMNNDQAPVLNQKQFSQNIEKQIQSTIEHLLTVTRNKLEQSINQSTAECQNQVYSSKSYHSRNEEMQTFARQQYTEHFHPQKPLTLRKSINSSAMKAMLRSYDHNLDEDQHQSVKRQKYEAPNLQGSLPRKTQIFDLDEESISIIQSQNKAHKSHKTFKEEEEIIIRKESARNVKEFEIEAHYKDKVGATSAVEQKEEVKRQDKADKDVLWIDFNEQSNKKQIKKMPQLQSKQSKIKERPKESQKQVQDKEAISSTLVPQMAGESTTYKAQKEAWAMDFTDKQESQPLDSFQDAFKKRMEQRMKKKNDQQEKKDFTKEELFERKKELLKNARQNIQQKLEQHQQPSQFEKSPNSKQTSKISIDLTTSKHKQQNKQQLEQKSSDRLMMRLAQGQKDQITKKDMIKLTSKNYEQLPEIQRRKKESEKLEDLKKRLASVKEMENKRRQSVVTAAAKKKQSLQPKQTEVVTIKL